MPVRSTHSTPHPLKAPQKPPAAASRAPVRRAGSAPTARREPAPGSITPATTIRATDIRLERTALHGTYSGPIPRMGLALLLDGAMVAAAKVRANGAFTFDLPATVLAGTLDVIAIPSGHGVLPAPIQIDHQIEWLGWFASQGAITGRFRLPVKPASLPAGSPILVQAYAEGRLLVQAFATPEPNWPNIQHFQGPIRQLIDQGQPLVVRPRLNGFEFDQPLTVTAQDVGIVGCLDPAATLEARGWVIDLTNRTRRIDIELRLDGQLIAAVTADEQRDDLRDLGLSDGRSGFTIPFPPGLDRRHPVSVQIVIAGTETELVGSPRTLAPVEPVIGYFDVIEGPFANGWAINMHETGTPLAVEAFCDGEVIGAGLANLYRADVEESGMPTPWCGFRFMLERPLVSLFDRDITIRVTDPGSKTGHILGGSPRQISQNANVVRFLTRSDTIPAPRLQRLMRRMTHQTRNTLITIIMPVYNTRREWLVEAVNSVLQQWSQNWELIVVDDGSTEPHVAPLLAMAASHDARIRIIRSPGNLGIAGATNLGLRAARGVYVAFMDHDDTIEPDAVYKLASAAQTTGADLIYSDEAVTTEDITSIVEVRARPAFSHDYYLSHPYFVHIVCVRTALAQQLQGWDERLAISADVDFVLRAIEQSHAIAHVPSVLYRWRTHTNSAGHARMEEVTATMKGILARHLARSSLPATVSEGLGYNQFRLDWPDQGGEVLIVIPTKNRVDLLRTCIDSVERTCGKPDGPTACHLNYRIVVIDHESTDRKTVAYLKQIAARHTVMPYRGVFNYALMNNLAVAAHAGAAKHLLFLNNDVEAIEDGWLQRLRSLSGRPEVGAVGPLLLYQDKRIQHAGVLMAFNGAADHVMKLQEAYLPDGRRHCGYNCILSSVRDYSAVTAACVMVRRDVFDQLGGFDESFVVGFNDTDLCLRIREAGFRILYDGLSVLYHRESATRSNDNSVEHPEDDARLRTRWARFFRDGDPFYSALLAPRGNDHTLRRDAGCKAASKPMVVHRIRPEPAPPRAPPHPIQARPVRSYSRKRRAPEHAAADPTS